MAASALERVRDALEVRYRAAAFRRAVRVELDVPIETIGDPGYGGYSIPRQLLGPDSLLVSVGAGTDVSFELELVAKYGCRVFIYDPVPAAAEYANRVLASEPRVSFERLAIWNEDTDLEFHAPLRGGFVSHSAVDLHGTPVSFTAPARTLSTLAAANGWTQIDLLKVSAEGSEFAILEHALRSGLDIRAVAVEWAQPVDLGRVKAAIGQLRGAGFRTVAVSGRPRNHKMSLLRP